MVGEVRALPVKEGNAGMSEVEVKVGDVKVRLK